MGGVGGTTRVVGSTTLRPLFRAVFESVVLLKNSFNVQDCCVVQQKNILLCTT